MAKITRHTRATQPPSVQNIFVRIAKGILVSIVVSICCLILVSVVTLFTENNYIETHIQYIMVAITLISIFIGSVWATRHTESMGLIVGMIVGLLYVLFSMIISYALNQDSIIFLIVISKILAGLGAGAMGGLVGVNL